VSGAHGALNSYQFPLPVMIMHRVGCRFIKILPTD
jgi:hypothetical protein